jgi:hypothetical protein
MNKICGMLMYIYEKKFMRKNIDDFFDDDFFAKTEIVQISNFLAKVTFRTKIYSLQNPSKI